MRACGCDGRVPIRSPAQAMAIAARLTGSLRQQVLDACVAWLTDDHPEVTIKSGYTTQAYNEFERVAVGAELWAVERTACPFATAAGGCMMGTLRSDTWRTTRRGPPFGWLPTLLLRALNAPVLKELVRTRWVADAKVMVLNLPGDFPKPRWSTNQPYVSVSEPKKEVVADESVPETVQSGAD